MTPQQYIEACQRTKSTKIVLPDSECTNDLIHGTMGIVTEAGELLDAIKKAMFYGKRVDTVNIKEELGDLLWYVAIIIQANDWTFEEIMDLNIEKLKARYPEKFTEEKALNRDLEKERNILERGSETSRICPHCGYDNPLRASLCNLCASFL